MSTPEPTPEQIGAHLRAYGIIIERYTQRDGQPGVSIRWEPLGTRKPARRWELSPETKRILALPHTPLVLKPKILGDGSNMIGHVAAIDAECAAEMKAWLAEAPARQAAAEEKARREREVIAARARGEAA